MGNRPRILFVEDERSISEPFSTPSSAPASSRLGAHRGRGVGARGRIEPSLVLLDLTLPDGDGRDVCRELRRRSDVPIIMLTARGTETDRVVGLELGADDYVVKPFAAAEVIARIRAVLRRSAPRRARAETRSCGAAISRSTRGSRARHARAEPARR